MLEILLATYNGAEYLPAMLDSLDRQTVQDWTLVCRDDGSTDSTGDILTTYCDRRPGASSVHDSLGNLGIIRNFGVLLDQSTDDYVMLADQDDVWHPEKIERSLEAIRRIESKHPAPGPAMAYCDLAVVDADEGLLHPSYIDHQGLRQLTTAEYGKLLTQNVAPGCTMILNRSLLEVALPIPASACMHDWWLIQVAALRGSVGFLDECLIDYRQHGGNAVGANALTVSAGWQGLRRATSEYSKRLVQAQKQAGELLARYGEDMSPEQLALTQTFVNLNNMRPIKRRTAAHLAGLRKAGFVRNLAFYLFM